MKQNNPLLPVKLSSFEEISKTLNAFLVLFQTQVLIVPFLMDSLENIVEVFCARFTLPDVLRKQPAPLS